MWKMLEPDKKPLKLFYCYAHEDKALRNTLDSHLSALKRQKLIEIWYDGEISAGTEWEREINKHLSTADIVLLLVSAAFLASDYCYSKEMERALQRHEEGTARVVPIILRPVDWEDAPFSKLQILPTEAKPVTRWITPDDAYEDIAKKLRVVVKNLQASRKTINDENVAKPLKSLRLPPRLQTAKQGLLAIGMNVLNNLNRYWMVPLQTHANIYNDKGVDLNNYGQYKEALEAYEQAIRIDPNHAFAYNNKGNTGVNPFYRFMHTTFTSLNMPRNAFFCATLEEGICLAIVSSLNTLQV
jgi:tetratricopeptide (TPR) repeat protein